VLDVDGSPEVWAPDVKNVSSDTEAKVSGLVVAHDSCQHGDQEVV
jgi:hypothetical protein